MCKEEFARRNLNALLDELEQRQLFCKREQLVPLVFLPVRKVGDNWTELLQWLLSTSGFGFHSPLSHEQADRVLNYLAGYIGKDTAEQLATLKTNCTALNISLAGHLIDELMKNGENLDGKKREQQKA